MKKYILLYLFLSAIIISSCSQFYYTPNTQNVPMLNQKNEVAGSINLYAGGGTGVELQTAYAAGNHVGIQLNFGGGSGNDESHGGGKAHGGGSYFEAGPGYFLPFGTKKRFVFETYGIFSFGFMNTTYWGTDLNGSVKASMTRLAVQPSIGYKSKHFEMAFSLRAGNLSYNHVTSDIKSSQANPELQPDYLQKNKSQFFIEPAITLKAGGPSIKAQLQIGTSYDETNPHFAYSSDWGSLGLNFNIYKNKKTVTHSKTSYFYPSL